MTAEHRGAPSDRPAPGTELTIVKLSPDGTEAARYPGRALPSPPGWVAARAFWIFGRMDLGYLVFDPQDVFLEYFSLTRPYNAFGIYTSHGRFKGWYCNVTRPSWLDGDVLYWHDLYVDVVIYPDGRHLILDEDELARAELATRDPALHGMILAARDELLQLARARAYPFSEAPA
ncbi:MAG: DUF402 domain-containing protein [Sphaerobacter sp.]|nr:DUF402 domain-containing protein [Sphaerobacter sp.]